MDDQLLDRFATDLVRRYDHVQRLAEAHGAGFLVVWQPLRWVERCSNARAIPEEEGLERVIRYLNFSRNLAMVSEAVTKKMQDKPYFINLNQALCGRTEPAYQSDGVHLTDAGRRMMAQRLAELLPGYVSKSPGGN